MQFAPLPDVEAVNSKRRILARIQEFLARGHANGSLCPDVAAADVRVLSPMMATPLPPQPGLADYLAALDQNFRPGHPYSGRWPRNRK